MDTDESSAPMPEDAAGAPVTGEGDALTPVLSEALEKVFTALRRSTRKHVGDLARKGRERMDEYQARKDVDRLYQKLGRETIRLIEAGEIDHPALQNRLERIRRQEELVREAERLRASARPTANDPTADDTD